MPSRSRPSPGKRKMYVFQLGCPLANPNSKRNSSVTRSPLHGRSYWGGHAITRKASWSAPSTYNNSPSACTASTVASMHLDSSTFRQARIVRTWRSLEWQQAPARHKSIRPSLISFVIPEHNTATKTSAYRIIKWETHEMYKDLVRGWQINAMINLLLRLSYILLVLAVISLFVCTIPIWVIVLVVLHLLG